MHLPFCRSFGRAYLITPNGFAKSDLCLLHLSSTPRLPSFKPKIEWEAAQDSAVKRRFSFAKLFTDSLNYLLSWSRNLLERAQLSGSMFGAARSRGKVAIGQR